MSSDCFFWFFLVLLLLEWRGHGCGSAWGKKTGRKSKKRVDGVSGNIVKSAL
jgi:hypothetical protein